MSLPCATRRFAFARRDGVRPIAHLRELRRLDLRGNPLASLPEELADLPKFDKLDLRWTPLLRAPPWLARLEARDVLVYR